LHYLTKWMARCVLRCRNIVACTSVARLNSLAAMLAPQVALNRMSLARGEPRYNDLAIQLAKAVHRHFVYETEGARSAAPPASLPPLGLSLRAAC
jgi:hypothetical protein